MKIKQLSIFLENRVGVINEVTTILSKNGVNMQAFSVAEGVEFGIMRLIVSDVEATQSLLEKSGFKVNVMDVIGINTPNTSGSLSAVLDCLAKESVFIQYMYAFSEGEMASTIIRPTNIERCQEVLESCREELSNISPLYKV